MRRRSFILIGILLYSIIMGGCSRKGIESSDEIITEDYAIYKEEELNEKINIADNKKLQDDDSIGMNHFEQEDNRMAIDQLEQEYDSIATNQFEQEDNSMTIDQFEQEDKDSSTAVNETYEAIAFSDQYNSLTIGSILDTTEFSQEILESLFNIEELNQELIDRISGKSYKEDADIPYSDLRHLRLLHIGFDGLTHVGEMIVNKAIAEDVMEIFKELYQIEYQIEKILLIDEYDADDLKSMADNNSSAFNYRFVEGTSRRSVHSDGLAIDINPLYNPYVRTRDGILEILPENGTEYVDRDLDNRYYIRKDDPCYKAFVSRGFTWGGEWKNSKDYQHFEKKLSD